jgi:hypothetical protein
MKKPFLTAALGVTCISAFAQGTLDFANAGPGYHAQVTDTDGVTGLAGSAWEADLYWVPGTVTDSTLLLPLNQPATFSTNPVLAGYFFGGNERKIPGADALSTITAQIRVWDTASGSSWVQASTKNGARIGESILFQVGPLGGDSPPLTPAIMTGLGTNAWSVHVVSGGDPAPFNYHASGGNLVISWSQGVLQSSSQINGTFTNITSATSPYSVPIGASGSQQFYRLRIP